MTMLVSFDVSQVGEVVGQGMPAPHAEPVDVRAFESLMRGDLTSEVAQAVESFGRRADAWRDGWKKAGEQVNLSSNMSVVRALEHQAQLSSEGVRLQLSIEMAGALRTGFKTLYQQQA